MLMVVCDLQCMPCDSRHINLYVCAASSISMSHTADLLGLLHVCACVCMRPSPTSARLPFTDDSNVGGPIACVPHKGCRAALPPARACELSLLLLKALQDLSRQQFSCPWSQALAVVALLLVELLRLLVMGMVMPLVVVHISQMV